MSLRHVVPPYLLDAISERGAQKFPRAARAAGSCRMSDENCRNLRSAGLRYTPVHVEEAGGEGTAAPKLDASGVQRIVHDAQNGETLPGVLVRSEGEDPVDDEAVNEAYDGLGASYSLFSEVFGRDSLDGKGMPLLASVHYGQDYDNAFFDGRVAPEDFGDQRV